MSQPKANRKGAIAWMAQNYVAANLAAGVLILVGIISMMHIKQEVFPEFDLDMVSIVVPYPGASPAEVEKGVILAIEEAVRGLDGVKEVRSVANEGVGTVLVELMDNTNENKALTDIKNAVDRIVTFPQEAERPIVSLVSNRHEVIDLMIYGDASEKSLRAIAEKTRDDLQALPQITEVDVAGVRKPQINIEVPQAQLRAHNLTLDQIAARIRRAAVEMPAGGVKTPAGEVLLRTEERRDFGEQFEDVVVASDPSGSTVRVGDIARVDDGFEDSDISAHFYGKPAVRVKVYRIGKQTPFGVARAVKSYIKRITPQLPPGIHIAIWRDWSEILHQRINLLLSNAFWGFVLVLLTLGLFLEIRLAFWVTFGIPLSFLGSMVFLPAADISINMITLFALIITLGMVVDDAIVIGENTYKLHRDGMPMLDAAIRGAREMAMPVTFAVLTTLAAFLPLSLMTGIMGKFMRAVPIVVTSVLLLSTMEAFFVLPSHLGHLREIRGKGLWHLLNHHQQKVSRGLEWMINHMYAPVLRRAMKHRYLTLSIAIAMLFATLGLIRGGHIEFTFMPKVDSDVVSVNAVLPYGSPVSDTKAVRDRLVRAAWRVINRHGGRKLLRGFYSKVGASVIYSHMQTAPAVGSNLTGVQIFMVSSDKRKVTSQEFAHEWRKEVGEIPGLESITFKYNAGPSAGAAIDIQLAHHSMDVLKRAGADLARALSKYKGVYDVDDGYEEGKQQFDLKMRPNAQALGVTATDLGRQVRAAFYGAEALRQQRGRDEVKVMVRLPESERRTVQDIENLLIRTPMGTEIPLFQAARVIPGHAYTTIHRTDGRRTVDVTADVPPGEGDPNKIRASLNKNFIPKLKAKYPGLIVRLEGEQKEMRDSMGSLKHLFLVALLLIFVLLAVPLRSYIQPLIVMTAIPFGLVGAVIGHLMMGFNLSVISMMGVVALSGVVVNDSLLLVDTANVYMRKRGLSAFQAMFEAGVRRFRPVMLTSVTTFFGLAPMIFEKSVQARFLIPMAISLGFGLLFATFITLLIVPALDMIVTDAQGVFRRRAEG